MARKSSIDRLPQAIQAEIGRLNQLGWTLDQILEHLRTLLDVAPSRSALGRHVQRVERTMARLRQTRQISIMLITHDLGTVGYFADRIAVVYLGRIVEIGPTAAVLANPQHPYTKALLSVVPVPNPRLRRERVILQGETPNPIHLPSGCRFHPRCPMVMERCKFEDPPYVDLGNGHQAACWVAKT